jgi:hypothetical protein
VSEKEIVVIRFIRLNDIKVSPTMMERSIVIRKNNFSMKRTYYANQSRSVDIDS